MYRGAVPADCSTGTFAGIRTQLGAGIAGLSLAHFLKKKSIILEREKEVIKIKDGLFFAKKSFEEAKEKLKEIINKDKKR